MSEHVMFLLFERAVLHNSYIFSGWVPLNNDQKSHQNRRNSLQQLSRTYTLIDLENKNLSDLCWKHKFDFRSPTGFLL